MEKYHDLNLISLCGKGRYGEVWLCRDLSGKMMAVKIISKTRIGEEWERELKGIRNYREITEGNPHLLKIGFVGEDEESFFYTMEAADSCSEGDYKADTLAERLNAGPLSDELIFSVLSGVFVGIKAIHQAGFAHRDIKPDNILFVNGVPKIADMGLLSSVNSSMTQVAGTPDFVPPEMFGSTSSDSKSRQNSDLYAFGKVIYCVVSGQEPQNFPTLPHELKLTLAGKLFMRLSMRLSHREPEWRIHSLDEVEHEMHEIERKLTYGETLGDRIAYSLKSTWRNSEISLIQFTRWSLKHWLLLLPVIVILAPVIWYIWPRKPFDIADVKFKTYRDEGMKFSLKVPAEWDVMTTDSVQKRIADRQNDPDFASPEMQAKIKQVQAMVQGSAVLIYCDYVQPMPDNLYIQRVHNKKADYEKIPDDVLSFQMRESFKQLAGEQTEVYEVKRCRISDVPCVYAYMAPHPGKFRMYYYLFLFENEAISFAMVARDETHLKRKEQVESVLKTLKFEK